MQTTTTLCRRWTTKLTTDGDANNDAATQTMGNNADDNDAAADVDTVTKTTR